MKMLMFDFRESEMDFFNRNDLVGYDIEFIKKPLNKEFNLTENQINETQIISAFVSSELSADILKRFKNLRIVTTRSTGYNHIDIDYCNKNHIAVFNVPEYGSESVAQYTFMLILALVRNLMPAMIDTKNNEIKHSLYEGMNLNNLTLGIIGAGAIGSSLAKIANFFNMKIYICSKEKNKDITHFVNYVSFEELLRKSDIISLHIPSLPETYHIINNEAFAMMKQGVCFVNTARGELVDINALYKNILSGKIKGAALDVLECESLSVGESYSDVNLSVKDSTCISKAFFAQKLLSKKNVIITPHIAYNTKESIDTILNTTFISISDYLKGGHKNQIF